MPSDPPEPANRHRRHVAGLGLALAADAALGDVRPGQAPRAPRPMFKGVELYSWTDPATGGWRFVLLPGTNRDKTAREVLGAPDVARSAVEIKKRLAGLARGESVAWLVAWRPGLAPPPAAMVDDIVAHAARAEVVVRPVRR